MVTGLKVVVTGKIPGESRQTAEAKLRTAGALVQSSVTATTDVLVTGANVGATKLKKAQQLGVSIVGWEDVFTTASPAASGKPSPSASSAPTPASAARIWAPMLAQAGELPTGEGWLYEVKWDGIRGVATVGELAVTIHSRSGKSDLTERFPTVVEELENLPPCVLDGELVALDGNGDASFQELQLGKGSTRYIVFDLLELNGTPLVSLPLIARQEALVTVLAHATGNVVSQSPVFEDGRKLLDHIEARSMEGIVAKRAKSAYLEGRRDSSWVKVKVRNEQEFVVIGYTPGEGSRASTFGSLILAVNVINETHGGVELTYCGKVGTGFDQGLLEEVCELFVTDEVPKPPEVPRDVMKEAIWVQPFVAQVAFQRWTEDGRLWHPAFLGVREDKEPEEVTKET